MTAATGIPPRFPRATAAEEADRLAAIREGRDWRPRDAERVRQHRTGATGWRRASEIYADQDGGRLALLAYYRHNSQADQEDFGLPPAGWYTAYGYWLPIETEAEA
jgi:hypothetical protein